MKKLLATLAVALTLLTAPAHAANIVETAKGAGVFDTLLAAAKAAGLLDDLKRGPITVFAPTDDAFARLPPGTVDALLKPGSKAKLAAILAYHVVPGRVLAADVPTKPTFVGTLNRSQAKVLAVRKGHAVTVNGVRVTQADIRADNGVIHVINEVLWPGELR